MEEAGAGGVPYRETPQLVKNLGVSHLSSSAVGLIYQSWRKSTAAKYEGQISKFLSYCIDHHILATEATVSDGLEYLTYLFEHEGRGYSYINGARSALSTFINCGTISFGKQFLVSKLMKGVFNLRPSLPRYATVWNVKIVLDHLRATYVQNMTLS